MPTDPDLDADPDPYVFGPPGLASGSLVARKDQDPDPSLFS
jgi:hypothetical protein